MTKKEQLSSKASKCDRSVATKLCINCNLPVRGHEAEGDRPICLTCLASLTPHCSFDGGYYSPDAVIKMGKILQTIEQSSSKASECDESEANKEKEEEL